MLGRVPAEPFWNSFSRDWTVARFQSVPAFLPRRASMEPCASGNVRYKPQLRGENCWVARPDPQSSCLVSVNQTKQEMLEIQEMERCAPRLTSLQA